MSKENSLQTKPVAVPQFGMPDIAMIVMATGWGLNFLVIKVALFELSPLVFTSLRHIGASILLLIPFALRRGSLRLSRRDWLWILALGLIGVTIHQPLAMYGTAYTTAGNAGLLLSSTPVFVALINHFIRWEQLERRAWFGVGISFLGMACVIGGAGSGFTLSSVTLVGDLICIAGAVMWALYTVLAQPLLKRYDSANLSALILVAGTIPLLVLSTPQFLSQDWTNVSSGTWTGVAYSFVVSIAIGNVIWNWGIQKLGAARASIYSNLSPAIALAAGAWFLGDQLTPLRVAGATIVIIGIYLARSSVVLSKLESE
jgi:drug/metabolite transporter (DMT)-like permease